MLTTLAPTARPRPIRPRLFRSWAAISCACFLRECQWGLPRDCCWWIEPETGDLVGAKTCSWENSQTEQITCLCTFATQFRRNSGHPNFAHTKVVTELCDNSLSSFPFCPTNSGSIGTMLFYLQLDWTRCTGKQLTKCFKNGEVRQSHFQLFKGTLFPHCTRVFVLTSLSMISQVARPLYIYSSNWFTWIHLNLQLHGIKE